MTREYHNGGNQEVDEKIGVSALFTQSAPGIAYTGTLFGLQVTQTATASGSVQIGMGAGVVQGSLTAGASLLTNPAPTLDIFTANPVGALPRYDIVVFDAITATVTAIIGTASATPNDPTVPNTALKLARIRNVANATSIDAAHIDDLRQRSAMHGGVSIVNSASERALLLQWPGRVISRTDTDTLEQSDGSAWWQITPGTWQSFGPFLYQNMTGTPAAIGVTVDYARWRMLDAHTVQAQVSATRQAGTTVTNGLGISLPVAAAFRSLNCGSLIVAGSSVPTSQSGIAYMSADKTCLIPVAPSNGYLSVDPLQSIRYNVTYEV